MTSSEYNGNKVYLSVLRSNNKDTIPFKIKFFNTFMQSVSMEDCSGAEFENIISEIENQVIFQFRLSRKLQRL